MSKSRSSDARFPALDIAALQGPQQALARELLTASKGYQGGPIGMLLRSPEMSGRLRRVISYLNLESSVPKHLNEMAILIQAAHWQQEYEWWAHYTLALRAGLPQGVADAIKDGNRPGDMPDDMASVYDFCVELSHTHRVSDSAFDALRGHFNDQQIVDLIAVSGIYATLAMMMNVAEISAPQDAPIPSPGMQ